jgi:hypothetical protein
LSERNRLVQKFGIGFPGFSNKDPKKWREWLEHKRREQEPVMRDKKLHISRHRRFRVADQWISTRDGRKWRQPQEDKNTLRLVQNIFGPALDFRLSIVSEQRPGFKYEPLGTGIEGRESSEAQQAVAEYYFKILRAWMVFIDALYNAQTDGVAFVHLYVDKNAGPKSPEQTIISPMDERYFALQAAGYQQSADGSLIVPAFEIPQLGQVSQMPAEAITQLVQPGMAPSMFAEGDLANRVVLAHETLADPEARTLNGPVDKAKWFMTFRARDVENVRIELNDPKIEGDKPLEQDEIMDLIPESRTFQRGLPPWPMKRSARPNERVMEWMVYFNDGEDTEGGRWVKVIGEQYVEIHDELPGGVIPFARFTDGSMDTDLYPRPVVSDWVPDQIGINALLSALMTHARLFAGGRLLAQKDTIVQETYSKIIGSVLEYSGGSKPEFMTPQRASGDGYELLQFLIRKLEDKTGWNDLARGQVSSSGSSQDVSGRAVLAQRELFERTFGPFVRAAAEGATEWAHIVVRYAQWLFDTPRLIPMVGRPDLAKLIDKEKLGDRPSVYCDPETLVPVPRALRNQMLFDMLGQGMITLDQYHERAPYAEVRGINFGNSDQWQRAQWVNMVLEQQFETLNTMMPEQLYAPSSGVIVLWQDDPVIHKKALGELILDEKKPWALRRLAMDRWEIYDGLEKAKIDATGMFPVPAEVLGVPPSKLQLAMATGAPNPNGDVGAVPGTPLSSPTPSMGGSGGMTSASQDSAQPLGSFGAVEADAQQ